MIFFGTRGSSVNGYHHPSVTCDSCGNEGMNSFGVRRYFHLYWIPTFITSAEVGLQCPHCKKTAMGDELVPDARESLKSNIFNAKANLPYYTGLFLICALFIFVAVAAGKDKLDTQEYALSPATDDIYLVDLEALATYAGKEYEDDYQFAAWKVIDSDGIASLEVIESEFVYQTKSGLSKDVHSGKALQDSQQQYPTTISFDDISALVEANVIYEIRR